MEGVALHPAGHANPPRQGGGGFTANVLSGLAQGPSGLVSLTRLGGSGFGHGQLPHTAYDDLPMTHAAVGSVLNADLEEDACAQSKWPAIRRRMR